MPYFKNNDTNILFIHIPKTGGTSVEQYFSKKFNIPLNNKSLYLHLSPEFKEEIKINSSMQHMPYNVIFEYIKEFEITFDNIKIITIVRNPYERIISDLFNFKIMTIDKSKEEVFDLIKPYLLSEYYDNHNIPQFKFIVNKEDKIIPEIHILHTETLTNDMRNLGYDDFNNYDNLNKHKVNCYDYLNDDSIKLINDFYHFDFEFFNYTKIEN